MQIHRKTIKKLASLSAFGAGALTLGAMHADASVIYSGLIDVTVGFDGGDVGSYFSPGLGNLAAQFGFSTFRQNLANASYTHIYRTIKGQGNASMLFKDTNFVLYPFPANAKWGNGKLSSSQVMIAKRTQHKRSSTSMGAVTFTTRGSSTSGLGIQMNKYALFDFNGGAQTDYGWILFDNAITQFKGVGTGPDFTIVSYAYDNTGALIAAGDTGQSNGSPVPEPDCFALSGLGALALGAVGHRRWRAARAVAK
jgi:hypothetical protein